MSHATNIVYSLSLAALLASCGTSGKFKYFGDMADSTVFLARPVDEIRLAHGDRIAITVGSRDAKLASLFGLSRPLPADANSVDGASAMPVPTVYTVDRQGDIDMPVLGKLRVAGLTRDSVGKMVQGELTGRRLLADATVCVECENLFVTVLGEVNNPGRYAIDRDYITIFDALGMAGDITKRGERRNVVVVRSEGNERKAYRVNLCLGEKAIASPVYYLKQNDVVYVEPR